ncbi:MAG: hypothetical protein JNL97_03345 [Verrucomicrobiales bacterium]|nr:hypothetical protein [Verrucomicrobiales bacterium]
MNRCTKQIAAEVTRRTHGGLAEGVRLLASAVSVPRPSAPSSPRTAVRRRTGGFTRTDLVVALASVSVLASIGWAAWTSTRRKARTTQCLSSVATVGRAILDFARDSEDTLPQAPANDTRDIWWWYKEQVRKYAGLAGPSSPDDKVFACPDDRGYSDPKPFHQNPRFDFTSYVFNGVTLPSVPNIAGWRTSEIVDPKRTLLVMEWTAHGPLSWHRSRTGRKNLPFYDGALSVLGFVDGHVRFAPVHYDGHNAAFTRDPAPGYEYRYSGK